MNQSAEIDGIAALIRDLTEAVEQRMPIGSGNDYTEGVRDAHAYTLTRLKRIISPCLDCRGVGRVIDVYAADDESSRSCGQCFGTGLDRSNPPGRPTGDA